MSEIKQQKLTVLMTVYNAERYVRDAIDSILNQSHKDFCFLIINDGSSDDSLKIINSFDDKRITVLNNEKNYGLVASLNKGIAAINSEYIVRMDADDISLPYRLETQLKFMEQNPDIGVSSAGLELFDLQKSSPPVVRGSDTIKALLLFNSSINHAVAIIRTAVLKSNKILYRSIFPHMEDYDLWYRLKDVTKFENINEVLYKYRIHGENVTVTNRTSAFERKKMFYRETLKDLGIIPEEEELNLHLGLSESTPLRPDKVNLLKYRNWLDKIAHFNKQSNLYSQYALENVLLKKWEQLFYYLPPYGEEIVQEYFRISGKKLFAHRYYFFRSKMKKRFGI